ncbi:LacI family DNA-binding transcriptional regulator [Paenibacillus sp. YPG26]|uniref:LacI family DNA-binding transcriptional regulator n=1 Tax=Paenibacillus sp. YPG26 TaxID=2878915 RepID=UPI00203F3BEB|nr:LacI family DNA-binding transcriptional regulator [Paenibacillus sp. YPG26]USB34552.1 LacI family DNA-binding transcriptional regulator [Paenibacillus sp. YPG26]
MARVKKVSMQDIANRLQISKNAVSLALLDKKGVSEEMKSRIVQTAKEMGYGPYGQKQVEHPNLLVVVPDRVTSYDDNDHFHFYHDMIWGLESSIRKSGYNAIIVRVDHTMEKNLILPGLFEDIKYAGVILFGIMDKAYAEMIWKLDTPLVMLDSYYRDLHCPVVTSANMEGAYEAADYLIGKGHTRIGFIGPANLTTSHEERWYGFWRAMQSSGIKIEEKWCLTYSNGFDSTQREITGFLDRMGDMPTAFLCGNDRIALLLSQALQARGIRLPADISIMGFDDLNMSETSDPPLTTMRVNKTGMCDAAVELLISRLSSAREMVRWSIPPMLIERDSTAAL